MGDSVGQWEGDTLVVDTTNFTSKTQFRGSSDQLHVVERFTRTDANTLLYRFTVDDPSDVGSPVDRRVSVGRDRTSSSTNTPATRATTRSAACCAARVRQKPRRLKRRSSVWVVATAAALTMSVGCGSGKPPSPPPGPQLMSGLSAHHHPIATANAEAQKFFDQGFALVFAFNHEEAVRSFQRAAELDPKAAMPHWGIAWALGPELQPRYRRSASEASVRGDRHRQKRSRPAARRTSASTSTRWPSATRRIPKADRAALAREVQPGHGRAVASPSGRSRCRDAVRREPDEPAAVEAVDARWQAGRRHRDDRRACSSRCSRRDPESHRRQPLLHPHRRGVAQSRRARWRARNGSRRWRRPPGISSTCRRTSTRAPAITPAAARANLAGAEADRAYLKTAPADSFYALAYYSHNLHFLADSHMMQGRLADARKAAAELAERLDAARRR